MNMVLVADMALNLQHSLTALHDWHEYGLCGSRNSRRFGRRATDLKNGNAGPKKHWRLWEKSDFSAITRVRYFLADNKRYDGNIWAYTQLFLAYCLYIGPILKEWQRKDGFPPIDSNAVEGPALPIAICREIRDAMLKSTAI